MGAPRAMSVKMNLGTLGRMTETQAREYLESLVWPTGPVCPFCASANAHRMAGGSTREGVVKCRDCRKQYTVTVGTILHRSKVPLKTWLMAFFLLCGAKKGMSALQLQRHLGIGSYQTAWHMAHRIRYAMSEGPLADLLTGDVEVDETYVGGKPRRGDGKVHKPGRGTSKTPVIVAIERGGVAVTAVVKRCDGLTLRNFIRKNVSVEARILTDDFSSYRGIGGDFIGGHEVVEHGKDEFVRGDVHVNGCESFNSLLKRSHVGAFHKWGRHHVHRYAGEVAFRWSYRDITDGERTAILLGRIGKKILTLRPVKTPLCVESTYLLKAGV